MGNETPTHSLFRRRWLAGPVVLVVMLVAATLSVSVGSPAVGNLALHGRTVDMWPFVAGPPSKTVVLIGNRPGAAASEPFHPGFEISTGFGRLPQLSSNPDATVSETHDLEIIPLPDGDAGTVASIIAAAGGRVVASSGGLRFVSLHGDFPTAFAARSDDPFDVVISGSLRDV